MAELAETEELPFNSEPQTYMLSGPVMHAEADRQLSQDEFENGGNIQIPEEKITGPLPPPENLDQKVLEESVGQYQDMPTFQESMDPWFGYGSDVPLEMREKNAAFQVGKEYGRNRGSELPPDAPAVMQTTEDRMKFLDNFTQQNAGGKTGEESCGPTSVIGGAVLAKGPDGVTAVLDAADKLPGGESNPEIAALREKIKNGEQLTYGDMSLAQNYVHNRMNGFEAYQGEKKDPNAPNGTKRTTYQRMFSNEDGTQSELGKMYAENNMEIALVDNTPGNNHLTRESNHATLRVRDKDGKSLMYYDPYARRDGQIIGRPTDMTADEAGKYQNGIADYDAATRNAVAPSK